MFFLFRDAALFVPRHKSCGEKPRVDLCTKRGLFSDTTRCSSCISLALHKSQVSYKLGLTASLVVRLIGLLLVFVSQKKSMMSKM